MLAMLAAFGAEVATGKTIFAQIQTAPLLIGATFVTIIIASAVPVLRGRRRRNYIIPATSGGLDGHYLCQGTEGNTTNTQKSRVSVPSK